MKDVVYVSGPISLGGRCTEKEIEAFTHMFTYVAQELRNAGMEVINPCEVPPQETWEDYMRFGMRAVADCTKVVALPRWQESRGARLEIFVARELRIPVVEWSEDLL